VIHCTTLCKSEKRKGSRPPFARRRGRGEGSSRHERFQVFKQQSSLSSQPFARKRGRKWERTTPSPPPRAPASRR